MRVSVEEIEEQMICLIPDHKKEAIYVKKEELPQSIRVGDILELEMEQGRIHSVKKLDKEKKKRLETSKKKRELLLKRKKK